MTGGFHQNPATPKTNLTESNRELNQMYAKLRKIRETKKWTPESIQDLHQIHLNLESQYSQDWLLRYELLELICLFKVDLPFETLLRKRLGEISQLSLEKAETIGRGLELLKDFS